jgi:hypothetical protein
VKPTAAAAPGTPTDAGAGAATPEDAPPEGADRQPPLAGRAGRLAAGELGVAPEEVTVVSVEPVEWSDGSLGCPQPGQMYVQVITPGYRFVLEVAGRRYEVHTDARADGAIVFCGPATGGPDPRS